MRGVITRVAALLLLVPLAGCQLLVAGISAGVTASEQRRQNQERAAAQASAGGETAPLVVVAPQATGAVVGEAFTTLDADLRQRGYEPIGTRHEGRLGPGAEQDIPMQLAAGHCYAVAAVGDRGVSDLDLWVLDPSGRPVDWDVEPSAHSVVRVCAERAGLHTMRVQMRAGQGAFVYGAYHWPRGTRGPFELSGVLYVRVAEVTSVLGLRGYEPDPGFTPVKASLRREGDRREHHIALPGDGCAVVVVVGGDGVRDLDVRLADGSAELARDETHNAFPAVEACPPPGDPLTLTVEAAQGKGDYFFQVFRAGAS